MKILLISPEDFNGNNWGGVSTYTSLMAINLGKIRQDVTVLTQGKITETIQSKYYKLSRINILENANKIQILRLSRILISKFLPIFIDRILWGLLALKYVRKNGPFDIVEAPEWGNSTLFISLLTKQKIIVRLHRGWYAYKKDNTLPMNSDIWLACLLEFLSIICASTLVSPTKYILTLYKYLIILYKLKGGNSIHIIPYGVEINTENKHQKGKPQKNKYILYIGRIEIAKGIEILIHAFERIANKYRNVQLLIIGEDMYMTIAGKFQSYQNYLKNYLYKKNLENKVHFLGKKVRKSLYNYYNKCLFVVVPSIKRENSPHVILEAISYDKAVIASNTGGIPEIILNKKNGLLFTENNPKILARKMSLLIRNGNLRNQFEHFNKQYKFNYDIKKIILKTLEVYKGTKNSLNLNQI